MKMRRKNSVLQYASDAQFSGNHSYVGCFPGHFLESFLIVSHFATVLYANYSGLVVLYFRPQ